MIFLIFLNTINLINISYFITFKLCIQGKRPAFSAHCFVFLHILFIFLFIYTKSTFIYIILIFNLNEVACSQCNSVLELILFVYIISFFLLRFMISENGEQSIVKI